MSVLDPHVSHLPTEELLVLKKYEYFNNLVMINLTHSCTLLNDPDLCRNTMKYRNTHKRRDAVEIRLHFIDNK
jgi:hypothetical protein